MYKKYLLMLGIICAFMTGCSQTADEKAAEENLQTEEADLSTDGIFFEGEDIDGNTVSSDIFAESKLTMVNVWATYCNPCLAEMPSLGELAAEYAPEDFKIVGIVSDVLADASSENMDYVSELIDKTGADYTHLLMNKSLYDALLYEVTAVPTTYFIDSDGVILDTVVGMRDKTLWKEKIDALLEEM